MPHGVLVLDKPEGLSSAAAVDKVKRALRADRAGHGGTLDPMATGVLAICLGEATKLASYLLADDKAYLAEGVLGAATDTLDRTGTVTETRDVAVTRDQLLAAIAARRGEQEQIPPMFSALKQDGRRLYHRARAGEVVDRAPRRIRIDRLELVSFDPPHFTVDIACSKGTYVRSLVADLGADVGSCAHLTALRRTRSGRFTIAQAVPLDRLEQGALIRLSEATDLPTLAAPDELLGKIRNGVQLPVATFGDGNPEQFQLVDVRGALLAICHARDGHVVDDRVFLPA